MIRRLVFALLTLCVAGWAAAQPGAPQKTEKAALKKPAAAKPAKKKSGLEWAELNAEQQRILAPLKVDWENLTRERRGKWVGIARRYPAMKPLEQQRVQERMQRWANLSPEQRQQARENYRRMAKASAEKRRKLREQWAEYQASLPAEQRRGLGPLPANPLQPPP